MRPVDKAAVGDIFISDDELHNLMEVIQEDYDPYQSAKPALVTNLGSICSYCEDVFHQARNLQVEHVQPKGLDQYAHLKTKWTNLLLSCATCNGADNKDTKDVILGEVHLPHLNNTYKSLAYKAGGVVTVNPELTGEAANHAKALLELVGLDKTPLTSKPGDTRWMKRKNDWSLATRYRRRFDEKGIDLETLLDLIKNRGGWSIWFTVFKGCDEVRQRLISDFRGTSAACFDSLNHYEPIDRNPGMADPV